MKYTKEDKLLLLAKNKPMNTATVFIQESFRKENHYVFAGTFNDLCDQFFCTIRTNGETKVYYSMFLDGKWSDLSVAPFSSNGFEFEPYFLNNNILLVSGDFGDGFGVYYVTYENKEWSKPIYVRNGLNVGMTMYYSISKHSNIFYTYKGRIHKSFWKLDSTIVKENLQISGAHSYVNNEETIMLLDDNGNGKKESFIYISYMKDGMWSKPIKLPETINKPGFIQMCPSFSPDEKYIFFARNSLISGDIYWISADILQSIK